MDYLGTETRSLPFKLKSVKIWFDNNITDWIKDVFADFENNANKNIHLVINDIEMTIGKRIGYGGEAMVCDLQSNSNSTSYVIRIQRNQVEDKILHGMIGSDTTLTDFACKIIYTYSLFKGQIQIMEKFTDTTVANFDATIDEDSTQEDLQHITNFFYSLQQFIVEFIECLFHERYTMKDLTRQNVMYKYDEKSNFGYQFRVIDVGTIKKIDSVPTSNLTPWFALKHGVFALYNTIDKKIKNKDDVYRITDIYSTIVGAMLLFTEFPDIMEKWEPLVETLKHDLENCNSVNDALEFGNNMMASIKKMDNFYEGNPSPQKQTIKKEYNDSSLRKYISFN